MLLSPLAAMASGTSALAARGHDAAAPIKAAITHGFMDMVLPLQLVSARTLRLVSSFTIVAAIAASLLRDRHFLRLRRAHLRNVQCHRDEIVIAVERDEIHHALLTKLRDRGFVSCIVDIVLLMELRRKIVDDSLVVLHGGRTLAFGELCGGFRIEPRLHRQWVMRIPLVLRTPILRCDE